MASTFFRGDMRARFAEQFGLFIKPASQPLRMPTLGGAAGIRGDI